MRLESLGLKLASLAIAGLLWFVIAREKSSEIGLQVPLELQNFPKHLEVTGDPVNSVEVRLRASPGVIERLTPADIAAAVDVAGAVEGERILHITPDSIRVPFGVQVVKITPSSLTLDFERTVEKSIPVRPRLLGQPADGYEVAELRSDPAEVVVVGPRSRVADIESAFTEPVHVDGLAADLLSDVAIGVDDPMLRVKGTPQAHVTAQIREQAAERAFDSVAVEVRGTGGRVDPVRVVLAGPAAVLAAVPSSDVKAWVDGTQEGPATVTATLAGQHPGVTVRRVEPPQAELRRRRS